MPFIVNGRFGMLGVSFNDDTRFHLWAVEHLGRGSDVPATVLFDGYPLGPHTVAGALAHALGTSGAAALNAVLATSTIVAGLAAFGVLRDAAPARRLLVGLLVALPYLFASYYAQGAFKETILAALVLAFTVELRELERSGRAELPGRHPVRRARRGRDRRLHLPGDPVVRRDHRRGRRRRARPEPLRTHAAGRAPDAAQARRGAARARR